MLGCNILVDMILKMRLIYNTTDNCYYAYVSLSFIFESLKIILQDNEDIFS